MIAIVESVGQSNEIPFTKIEDEIKLEEFDDLFKKLEPFLIFKSSFNPLTDPIPIENSLEWINSTKIFPNRFRIVKNLSENLFAKVKLCLSVEDQKYVKKMIIY